MDGKKIELVERLMAAGNRLGVSSIEYDSVKITFHAPDIYNTRRPSETKVVKSSGEFPLDDDNFEGYQKLIDDPLAFEEDQLVQAQ